MWHFYRGERKNGAWNNSEGHFYWTCATVTLTRPSEESGFFIAKMKVVWDHTKILCPYPNQGYIPALDPLHSMKTILAIHTYPGKFYIQKRAISDFSSHVLECKQIALSLDFEDNPIYPFWDAHGQAR